MGALEADHGLSPMSSAWVIAAGDHTPQTPRRKTGNGTPSCPRGIDLEEILKEAWVEAGRLRELWVVNRDAIQQFRQLPQGAVPVERPRALRQLAELLYG
jgi:hypothetical protein